MGIDLHAHTTASDGSLSPAELVARAHEIGLSAIAVTDHDTVAGWEEAAEAGGALDVEVVPGVELSTSYPGGRFHLLGYYIEPQSDLVQTLRQLQAARGRRNEQLFSNLRALGVLLEEAEVRAVAGRAGGELGRPHFAQAMVARGYVASVQEAFDRYLADDGPAYAAKVVLTPREAISGIHEAGGVAVWAHPPRRARLSLDELEERLRAWIGWGLDGLEIAYSQYTPEEAGWALAMQLTYGLLGTGGSDFHGCSKPDIRLGQTNDGRPFWGGPLPREVLDQLKQRRGQVRRARSRQETADRSEPGS